MPSFDLRKLRAPETRHRTSSEHPSCPQPIPHANTPNNPCLNRHTKGTPENSEETVHAIPSLQSIQALFTRLARLRGRGLVERALGVRRQVGLGVFGSGLRRGLLRHWLVGLAATGLGNLRAALAGGLGGVAAFSGGGHCDWLTHYSGNYLQ